MNSKNKRVSSEITSQLASGLCVLWAAQSHCNKERLFLQHLLAVSFFFVSIPPNDILYDEVSPKMAGYNTFNITLKHIFLNILAVERQ
jgi:hypothetical protein